LFCATYIFHLHKIPPFFLFLFPSNVWITKDDIHTLANVVIANPTQMELLPQSCTTQRFVASNAAQAKEMKYLKIC